MKLHGKNGAKPGRFDALKAALPQVKGPPPHLIALSKVAQDAKVNKIKYGCGFKGCTTLAVYAICTVPGQQTIDEDGQYKNDPTIVFACASHIGLFKNIPADRICRLPKH